MLAIPLTTCAPPPPTARTHARAHTHTHTNTQTHTHARAHTHTQLLGRMLLERSAVLAMCGRVSLCNLRQSMLSSAIGSTCTCSSRRCARFECARFRCTILSPPTAGSTVKSRRTVVNSRREESLSPGPLPSVGTAPAAAARSIHSAMRAAAPAAPTRQGFVSSQSTRRVANFGTSLADGHIIALVLSRVAPTAISAELFKQLMLPLEPGAEVPAYRNQWCNAQPSFPPPFPACVVTVRVRDRVRARARARVYVCVCVCVCVCMRARISACACVVVILCVRYSAR